MRSKKSFTLAALIMGCSALGAGTTAAFAAANANSQPAPTDATISQQVEQKLAHELPNELWNVQVQTHDGVVTLSGHAATPDTEQKALAAAHDVHGVTEVKNRLSVQM